MNIHDGHEYISIKILINKISVETMQMNNEYLDLVNEYNNKQKELNNKKLGLVSQVNYLLEKQLQNPTQENQLCITALYKNINEIDNNEEINKITKKINNMQYEIQHKITIISNLEEKIPPQFVINKFSL
jgi:hypothetical protein